MRDYERLSPERDRGPVRERYQALSVSRQPFLDEARRCAALTIPALCPPDGLSNGAKLLEPYQAYGALGVKNLAEKICRALFPPGRSFFRLSVSQYELERQITEMVSVIVSERAVDPEAAQKFVTDMTRTASTELEHKLAGVEQAILRDFELDNNRPTDSEALKHLINDGAVVRYCPQSGEEQPRIYDLNHHVVKRDPDGTVLDIITREGITAMSVDPAIRVACGLGPAEKESVLKEYDLFTRIRRGEKFWETEQELNGVLVPGSKGTFPLDACPWVALRWTKIDGEDYGRSYVSDYRGSLQMLESLTQALHDGGVISARTIGFVNPNSSYGTRLRDVARAKNGDMVPGNAGDVTFLRVDKQNDMSWVLQTMQVIARDVSRAFLLNSSVQRDAERVTAQEITAMIQELEGILGGVYGAFGREYQFPILKNLMVKMRRAGSLPELPVEVEPTIITGVDALGRTADLEKLAQFGQFLGMFPPDIVREYTRFSDLLKQGAVAIGVKVDSLLKSEEEVAAERERAMEMQMAQQAVAPAINAVAQGMQQEQQIPPQ